MHFYLEINSTGAGGVGGTGGVLGGGYPAAAKAAKYDDWNNMKILQHNKKKNTDQINVFYTVFYVDVRNFMIYFCIKGPGGAGVVPGVGVGGAGIPGRVPFLPGYGCKHAQQVFDRHEQ